MRSLKGGGGGRGTDQRGGYKGVGKRRGQGFEGEVVEKLKGEVEEESSRGTVEEGPTGVEGLMRTGVVGGLGLR